MASWPSVPRVPFPVAPRATGAIQEDRPCSDMDGYHLLATGGTLAGYSLNSSASVHHTSSTILFPAALQTRAASPRARTLAALGGRPVRSGKPGTDSIGRAPARRSQARDAPGRGGQYLINAPSQGAATRPVPDPLSPCIAHRIAHARLVQLISQQVVVIVHFYLSHSLTHASSCQIYAQQIGIHICLALDILSERAVCSGRFSAFLRR